MRSGIHLAALVTLLGPTVGAAQSLSQQVIASSGTVQVIYPSRPSACGDGRSFIRDVMGHSEFYSGNANWSSRGDWGTQPCVHGPARLVVTVLDGEITRARAYVGPMPASDANVRTISATARDAAEWMGDILAHGSSRVASDMVLPLILADGDAPWPLLLRVARDENRPNDLKRNVMMWLSNGVSEHLGLLDADDGTDDDQLRTQAVYVLSQRPKSESVPQLIEVVRSAKSAAARKSAIYWLGQTGDPRAVEVYAELLGIR